MTNFTPSSHPRTRPYLNKEKLVGTPEHLKWSGPIQWVSENISCSRRLGLPSLGQSSPTGCRAEGRGHVLCISEEPLRSPRCRLSKQTASSAPGKAVAKPPGPPRQNLSFSCCCFVLLLPSHRLVLTIVVNNRSAVEKSF